MRRLLYRLVGIALWKGAKWYLRGRGRMLRLAVRGGLASFALVGAVRRARRRFAGRPRAG